MISYEFRCDCGRTASAEFDVNALKSLTCHCGAPMYRLYTTHIGGDLPSRHPHGYVKGALSGDDDMADGPLMKEVDYVEKHHGPSVRDQNAATNHINTLAKERRTRQRSVICDEALAKVDFSPPKGLDMTDGGA
jgi:hypothetical protein